MLITEDIRKKNECGVCIDRKRHRCPYDKCPYTEDILELKERLGIHDGEGFEGIPDA